MATGLTDQQQRFVEYYLADANLSVGEAAIKAGYSEKYAESQAYQLLRNPRVAKALDKEMAARARRTRVTHDRVLREIASVAFSNIDDYEIDDAGYVQLKEGADVRAMKAVSSIKRVVTYFGKDNENEKISTELKLWDKGKALDQLSQHLNLFKDHQEAGALKVPEHTQEREEMARKLVGLSNGDSAENTDGGD